MCGLCGVFGWIGQKEKEALVHLQIFSQLRGMDSTGVAVLPASDRVEPKIFTSLGGLESLVYEYPNRFNARDFFIKEYNLECIISHHRRATWNANDLKLDHAHPFEYDDIIGCHNGTVYKHALERLPTFKDTLIDSENILLAIDKINDVPGVLGELTGAWALVWWNKVDRTLHLVRNKERSLFIAYSSDGRAMFWASEAWMLHTALQRAGIKYNGKVGVLNQDRHFTFKDNGVRGGVEIVEREDAPGKSFQTPKHGGGQSAGTGKPGFTPANVSERKEKSEEKEKGKVVPLPARTEEAFKEAYAPGFGKQLLPKRRYLHLVREGCGSCDNSISWDDRHKIGWYNATTPLCSTCKTEWEEVEDGKRSVH